MDELVSQEIDDDIIAEIIEDINNKSFDISTDDYIEKILLKNNKMIHYIDNNEFTKLLIEYQEKRETAVKDNKPIPKIPDVIGVMINKLCHNLSRRHNFIGYTYRDEMIEDAIVSCINSIRTYEYKPDQTAAFTYFTFIASFAMVRRIKKEKREHQNKINMVGDHTIRTMITQEVDNLDEFFNSDRDSFYNIYADN